MKILRLPAATTASSHIWRAGIRCAWTQCWQPVALQPKPSAFSSRAAQPQITMVSIVSAPEGVAHLQAAHPDIQIVTASLDEGLNDRKYIVPGLGDFGDRLYGTL